MSQASQAKAMQEYFDALLNETFAESEQQNAESVANQLERQPGHRQGAIGAAFRGDSAIVIGDLVPADTEINGSVEREPTWDDVPPESPQPARQTQKSDAVPVLPRFVEPERAQPLAQLLSQVELHTEVEEKVQIVEVETKPEVAVAEPAVVTLVDEKTDIQISTDLELDAAIPPMTPDSPWRNLEPGEEFPALFFVVSGMTFAVPLTDLGGIHKLEKVTPLFGKPEWFAGVMMHRETQLNVVDAIRWFMPEEAETSFEESAYEYLVMLGESKWGISCHSLLGTETLSTNEIKWRDKPGKRPWLAGMVKERMCALLHVQELLTLLQQGVNIDGQ